MAFPHVPNLQSEIDELRRANGELSHDLAEKVSLLSRKDPRCANYPPQAMVDAFEASLVKHVAASAYWR